MAGKKGRSGRPKLPGRAYRLYIRYRPGLDPPELGELLEMVANESEEKRADILRAALVGGASQAQATAEMVESSATTSLLDEMFASF